MNLRDSVRTPVIAAILVALCCAAGCKTADEPADSLVDPQPIGGDDRVGVEHQDSALRRPSHAKHAAGATPLHRPPAGPMPPRPHAGVPHPEEITDAPDRPAPAPLSPPDPPHSPDAVAPVVPAEPDVPAANLAESKTPDHLNRPVPLPVSSHDQARQRPAVESLTLTVADGVLPPRGSVATDPGPALRPLLDASRVGADGSSAAAPARIPLPLGGTGAASEPVAAAAVQRGLGAGATLPALPLPPPSDRLAALALLRQSTSENVVLRFDGDVPRLLARAEAIRALEASNAAQVVLLVLSDQDAEAFGQWLDHGRMLEAPEAWLSGLQQSDASRAQRHKRQQDELDRVRAERNKLRDNMYQLLLGNRNPAPGAQDVDASTGAASVE